MSVVQKRTTAAVAVVTAAALFIALGVSVLNADEPKNSKPQAEPRLDPPAQPRLHPGGGAFNSADMQKAQEQMLRAMKALAKDPNDAEARKQLDEAQQMMTKALREGLPRFGFPHGHHNDRARLGVRLAPLTPLITDQLGLEPGHGVAITDVLKDSAAGKAGFQTHDIVVEFAGKPVTGPADFVKRISDAKAGEKVDAVVLRKGKRVELKGIDLPAPQHDAEALPTNPNATENGQGNSVTVSMANDAFTIKAQQDGVNYLITGKVGIDGAVAEKVNIKAGDEAVEAQEIGRVPEKYRPTVEKLLKLVGKPKPREKVRD